MAALPDNGVYYLPPKSSLPFMTSGLRCFTVDLAHTRTSKGVLKKLAEALAFPAWFGHNLDALFDCLSDPDGFAGHDTLLSLSGLHTLAKADADACSCLLEVLRAVTDSLNEDKRRCIIVIDSPLPDIAALPA